MNFDVGNWDVCAGTKKWRLSSVVDLCAELAEVGASTPQSEVGL